MTTSLSTFPGAPPPQPRPPHKGGGRNAIASDKVADYVQQTVPLKCEREPIHILNRIQPCGTLLVVDSSLRIVQCSVNAVDMLPGDFDSDVWKSRASATAATATRSSNDDGEDEEPAKEAGINEYR